MRVVSFSYDFAFLFFNCCGLLFPGHDGIIRGLVGLGQQRLVSHLLMMQAMYTLPQDKEKKRSTALSVLGGGRVG